MRNQGTGNRGQGTAPAIVAVLVLCLAGPTSCWAGTIPDPQSGPLAEVVTFTAPSPQPSPPNKGEGVTPKIVYVQVPAAPSVAVNPTPLPVPQTPAWWENLINSPMGTALIAALLSWVLLKAHVTDKAAFIDKARKVEATVIHAYNAAEDLGILGNWSGAQKLDHALQVFDTTFKQVMGVAATPADLASAKVQLAKVAYEDEPAPAASAPVTSATAVKGVAALIQKTE